LKNYCFGSKGRDRFRAQLDVEACVCMRLTNGFRRQEVAMEYQWTLAWLSVLA
jgi:hypothetical protein